MFFFFVIYFQKRGEDIRSLDTQDNVITCLGYYYFFIFAQWTSRLNRLEGFIFSFLTQQPEKEKKTQLCIDPHLPPHKTKQNKVEPKKKNLSLLLA